MDIDVWMNDLIDQLMIEFKERLVLVGLQGSRARGEQREDSDIDVVVIVKDLNVEDFASYRSVIQKMPYAKLACGFIGAPDVLAADACASEIYHALCHTAVFEPDMLPDLLQGCLKSVFFGIRAKHFAQTGEFVNSRAQLLNLASDDEQWLLQAYNEDAQMDDQELANRLLRWSNNELAGRDIHDHRES